MFIKKYIPYASESAAFSTYSEAVLNLHSPCLNLCTLSLSRSPLWAMETFIPTSGWARSSS